MGYYTSYSLKLKEHVKEEDKPVDLDYIMYQLRKENDCASYAFDENGETLQECKWYESTNDLKAFSKRYPTVLFELKGEGEESGDIWTEYFLNGKSQRCKVIMTYEKFDENKMK